jgi:MFS family permease
MPGYRDLARNRDFTVLWVGQTISEVGSAVSMFAFPLLAYALSRSAGVTALVEAVYLIGMTATLLPAGVVADRYDRRLVMRWASAVGALAYGSLAAAGVLGALTVPHVTLVALVTGITSGLFGPAEMSAVRSVVASEDLPTALSQNQARQHVASLVGAPVGGVLYSALRWLPFLVDAVSFVVAWVLLGRLRADLAPEPGPPARPVDQVREGVRFIRHSAYYRVLLVWASLVNLTVNAVFFVAILRLIQAHTPPAQIGMVSTMAGLGGILGAVVAPRIIDRVPTGLLTVISAWVFVPLMVPVALWNTPLVVGAALFVGLLLNPAGNAASSSYGMTLIPAGLQGRVSSASRFCSMSLMFLAPLIGASLLTALGGTRAVLALGLITGVVALIPTLSRPIRSVPRPAQWAQASGEAVEDAQRLVPSI